MYLTFFLKCQKLSQQKELFAEVQFHFLIFFLHHPNT